MSAGASGVFVIDAEYFPDAEVVVERSRGDLSVTDDLGRAQLLGLSDLRLALSAHDGLWQIAQGLAAAINGKTLQGGFA